MNILLVGVLALSVVSMIIGYMKGFIRIVISLIATIVTLVVVGMFSGTVADMIIEYTALDEAIETKFVTMIFGDDIYLADYEDDSDSLTLTQQIALIESAELPEFLKDATIENNNSEIYEQLGVSTFSEYIGTYLSSWVINVLSFIVTFLITWVIIRVIVFSLDVIANLPVLRGVNRVIGAILGLEFSFVIVWLFFLMLSVIYSTEIGQQCYVWIEESMILTLLYDNNPIIGLLL